MCAWRVVDPEMLGAIDLFADMNDRERALVAPLLALKEVRKGTLIVAEGSDADRMFFILDGAARVSRTIPGLGEEALAILPAGSYFGEMALFTEATRSADVYADARSTMLELWIAPFRALLDREPELAVKFLWACSRTLAERVRQSNAKVTFLSAAGQFS